jgi:hypothetical protein
VIEALYPIQPLELKDIPAVRVVNDVLEEMGLQDAKWGQQNHPDFHEGVAPGLERCRIHGIVDDRTARDACDFRHKTGDGSWCDILIEEVAEAVCTDDEDELREELVQVAAVVHQWIACIDRRQSCQEFAAQEAGL